MISLSGLKISLDMLSLVGEIDEFKGAWKWIGKVPPQRLAVLQQISIIENSGAALRLDGGLMSDQEIMMLLGTAEQTYVTPEERFIVGHAALLENIFNNYEHIDFSASTLLQFFNELYRYSIKGQLQATNPDDRQDLNENDIAFDDSFNESVSQVAESLALKKIHPLVTIAAFHAELLRVSPFPAGNRSLSQAVMQFLLLKSGYDFIPFCSLNTHVEQSAEVFFRAFGNAHGTEITRENLQPAMTIFLRVLQKQKQRLEQKLIRETTSVDQMSDLSQQLLELVKSKGRITISEASMLTRSSPGKVRKQLDTLVSGHQLQKHGTTKGVWYSMNA